MEQSRITIIYKGQRLEFTLRKGLGLQALVAQHPEIPLEFDCRAADCGICLVKILEGADQISPPQAAEKDFLKAMVAEASERLACQCRILGPVTVEVPPA